MERFECDLHCHTIRSDGYDSPEELIDNAAALGLKVIAITDHDITPPLTVALPGGGERDIREYARSKGVELVLGYEFSCDTYVDDVHILGYALDWTSPLIEEEVERAKRAKSDAYRELCEILTARGMPIDYEREILTYVTPAGEVKHRDPDEVQRKHIFEAMAAKGYAPTWQAAKLIVRDDPELNVRRRKIEAVQAIEVIHALGGTAVLAHPYLIDERIEYPDGRVVTREEYIARLIEAGLEGIEFCYPYGKTSYKGNLDDEEIKRRLEETYAGRVKFFTGGSDYHNDAKKGVKDARYLGERGISYDHFLKIKEWLVP